MLEISNLSHTYGSGPGAHTALGGIDLTVAEGELVCIVGPSGCGKSTLLRSIAGLLRPTGGQVVLNGSPVERTPDNLAVVFQDYSRSLFPWMSVTDNVSLPLRRKGMDKKQRRAAALEALEQVGLEGAAAKYPWQLSGGMQQRVSIARALAYRPTLLLMDEPFGSVDAQTREELEDLTLQVRSHHNMTIVLITHDIDESVYVGDRVVVLSKSPAGIVGDLRVDLPGPRDQITTREHPDFVHLRAEVGRLVRGMRSGAAPASDDEAALTSGNTAPDDETTSASEDTAPDNETTSDDEATLASNDETTSDDEAAPASDDEATSDDEAAPSDDEAAPTSEDTAPAPGAKAPASQEPASASRQGTPDEGTGVSMSDPQAPVWDAIGGVSRFAALATMAELGCADHLKDGPLSVKELAARCGADPSGLGRVLRQLASMGIVATTTPGVYELTEAGATLREDAPDTLRPAVRMIAQEGFWYGMGTVAQTVRTGRSAFIERHGPLYGYLKDNPEAGRLFDDYMVARAQPFAEAVAARYDFSGVRTLVDVAGGKGHILAAVLKANSDIQGVLFDLEQVIPGAREFFAEAGLEDRCKYLSGDFFSSVPAGADAYMLGSVIHNWSDEDAVRILRNIRDVIADDGRLLLVEFVVPDDDRAHISKDVDMRMLALFGEGLERSTSEYGELLSRAGFRFSRQVELPGGAGIVEARPV
ncbi:MULTISPECIES: methyltransferase [Streptosporangium]|uniref:ABC-type nitrate/sulfonate/bicarbonate transport system ATPase subunit/ubiquinone/menaquinone biosynthesis C-methylase UbiE n=1 Tax=Streptosporangium brasiliense TaxID=47480 RepID=A0ABT9QXG4_9ACTN|nr:methyltransferase [Streptosporangium brasiliense]MDP9860915.1 ABC-type nitrate/sulfonate/bicarbonate transport system ATPase subunit/ubiquinone/menaquinone biosynthesis C-methylase UbiE [Streptosporangium brasiliense]